MYIIYVYYKQISKHDIRYGYGKLEGAREYTNTIYAGRIEIIPSMKIYIHINLYQ